MNQLFVIDLSYFDYGFMAILPQIRNMNFVKFFYDFSVVCGDFVRSFVNHGNKGATLRETFKML